ncbi:MAG: hypothetical protein VX341_02695 [Bdellovibrionota bacterium]|nr:hypothetical protein [Bdellovibrionota bacterium]
MHRYVIYILSLAFSISALGVDFKKCHQADERLLKRATEHSQHTINDIVEQIEDQVEFNSDIDDDMKEDLLDARETLLCAMEKISRFQYVCYPEDESKKEKVMETLPFIGKEVNVYTKQMNRVAMDLTFQGVVGIVIHEATHKCGTTDANYFVKDNFSPYSSFFVSWKNVADTYNWWALKGFCIPHEEGKFSHLEGACVDGQ